jgi:hypothetical protein
MGINSVHILKVVDNEKPNFDINNDQNMEKLITSKHVNIELPKNCQNNTNVVCTISHSGELLHCFCFF